MIDTLRVKAAVDRCPFSPLISILFFHWQNMVEMRPPISLEDIEMAGNTADPVKLDTCNCDHCVSQAKLEQVVRKCIA